MKTWLGIHLYFLFGGIVTYCLTLCKYSGGIGNNKTKLNEIGDFDLPQRDGSQDPTRYGFFGWVPLDGEPASKRLSQVGDFSETSVSSDVKLLDGSLDFLDFIQRDQTPIEITVNNVRVENDGQDFVRVDNEQNEGGVCDVSDWSERKNFPDFGENAIYFSSLRRQPLK